MGAVKWPLSFIYLLIHLFHRNVFREYMIFYLFHPSVLFFLSLTPFHMLAITYLPFSLLFLLSYAFPCLPFPFSVHYLSNHIFLFLPSPPLNPTLFPYSHSPFSRFPSPPLLLPHSLTPYLPFSSPPPRLNRHEKQWSYKQRSPGEGNRSLLKLGSCFHRRGCDGRREG